METFNQIVDNWYLKLKNKFFDIISAQFKGSRLTKEDVENIYQNVFIAIYDNLIKGRIKENTSWQSYIMRIGFNMANRMCEKLSYHDNINNDFMYHCKSSSNYLNENFSLFYYNYIDEENENIYENHDLQKRFAEEFNKLPDNHRDIMYMHYSYNMKDAEIADELAQYSSAKSVKIIRNRCLKKLRLKMAFHYEKELIA